MPADTAENTDQLATLDDLGGAGPFIDVTSAEYGAVGDGVADDTDAVQAAITYAKANGGIVLIPIGVYRITDTLVCGANAKAYRMTGASPGYGNQANEGSVLRWDGNDEDSLILAGAAIGFELDHLRIEWSKDTDVYTGDVIQVIYQGSDSQYWYLHDLSFRNTFTASPTQTISGRSCIRTKDVINGVIEQCNFKHCDSGIRFDSQGYLNAVTVRNCRFNRNANEHILVGGGINQAVVIEQNTFEMTTRCAIRGGSIANGEVANNSIYSMTIRDNWFGDSQSYVESLTDNLRLQVNGVLEISSNMMEAHGTTPAVIDQVADAGGGVYRINGNHIVGGEIGIRMAGPSTVLEAIGNRIAADLDIDMTAGEPTKLWLGNTGGDIHQMHDTVRERLAFGPGTDFDATPNPDDKFHVGWHNTNEVLNPGIPAIYGTATNLYLTNDAGSIIFGIGGAARTTISSTGVGFNGQSASAPPNYTVNNPSTDRSFDVSTAAAPELAAVLGTLVSDLIAIGLLQ